MTEPIHNSKIREIIANAVAGLDPLDRAERIAYCRDHDEHGVRVFPEDGVLEFRWGGRTLAMIHTEDLFSAEPLPPAEFIAAELPDTFPAEWTEQ